MRDGVRAALWVLIYLAIAVAPLPLTLIQLNPSRGFVIDFSAALGFVGLAMLGLQFVLAARIHRVTAPFGMDVVLQFHRQISYVALAFVLAHPILLFVLDSRFVRLLNVFHSPLRAKFAVASVVLLLVLIASSLWRRRWRLPYAVWQLLHAVLAVLVVFTALVHVLLIEYYVSQFWEKILWTTMSAAFVALGIWVRIVKPIQRFRHRWNVVDVEPEPGGVVTITLAPSSPAEREFRFRPGQFAWIHTTKSPFALTYHPFSICSSAEDTSQVAFTIKAGGDFTQDIGSLGAGDTVYVDGPWGQFTMERHEGPGFVFIAGGVGVTPMLSMLSTLADRGDRRPCMLFLANHEADTIVAGAAIDELSGRLDLTVVHVLSQPREGWSGETGHLRAELFDRYLPDSRARLQYFICGSPPLIDTVEAALAELRIPSERVHAERFAMV